MNHLMITWLPLVTIAMILASPGCSGDQKSFDCKMRQLALDFAHKIQPFRSKTHFQMIADALNGAPEAQNCSVTIPDSYGDHDKVTNILPLPADMTKTFHVDAIKGKDSNAGSIKSPFKTIKRAVKAARLAGKYSTIILREGTFYLTETVELKPEDKGLTIQSYPEEEVWISGGKIITPKWEKYDVNPSKGTNIYKADISSHDINVVPGLRVDKKRAIRARYPNADPELGFGSQLLAKEWLPPTISPQPDTQVNPDQPDRNSSVSFKKYQLGIGGTCQNFDPPAGYWCGNNTEGGGAETYRIPSGMVANQQILPNSPYKNPKGAIVHAWRPAHWASWMFGVNSYDGKSGTFKFGRGGFQGARGNNQGAEFVVENVMEELDAPTEWFYDEESKVL